MLSGLRVRLTVGLVALVAVGAALLWLDHGTDVAENPAYDAIVAAHSRALAARRDSTREEVATADSAVTRTLVRYHTIRDTLNIHDTAQVKVFVKVAAGLADSVQTLQRTIADDRRATNDLLADKDIQIARAKLQPPRLTVSVSGLYDPLAQIPAASLDGEFRITANVSAVARVEQRFAPGEKPRVYVGGRVKV